MVPSHGAFAEKVRWAAHLQRDQNEITRSLLVPVLWPGSAPPIFQPMMLLRALLAFLAMPGMVAFAIPVLWLRSSGVERLVHPIGLIPLAAGVAGLLWCVRDFYTQGKGTLAPWSPPKQLVVVGLYRYSRNPMYLGVILMLLGWATAFHAWTLVGYAAAIAVAFHLRVVFGEEPWMASAYGAQWHDYARGVRRWV